MYMQIKISENQAECQIFVLINKLAHKTGMDEIVRDDERRWHTRMSAACVRCMRSILCGRRRPVRVKEGK